ncbi:MAG: hypothetical protein Q9166_002652 [cf. Caloplaca sp. 2 TL-2023]
MRSFTLALIISFLPCALALPAPPIHNNGSTDQGEQRDTASLTSTGSSDLKISHHILLAHPPAPYVYRIDEDLPYYLKFIDYFETIQRTDGDILTYQALHRLNRAIRDDPQHGRSPWQYTTYTFREQPEEHVKLTVFTEPGDSVTLEDLRYWVGGLASFMRMYGWVESYFQMFIERNGGFEKIAWAFLRI